MTVLIAKIVSVVYLNNLIKIVILDFQYIKTSGNFASCNSQLYGLHTGLHTFQESRHFFADMQLTQMYVEKVWCILDSCIT